MPQSPEEKSNLGHYQKIKVHAEFCRGHPVRRTGQGYLSLHPDVQEQCTRTEGRSNAERRGEALRNRRRNTKRSTSAVLIPNIVYERR
jgi:hypothetical protein